MVDRVVLWLTAWARRRTTMVYCFGRACACEFDYDVGVCPTHGHSVAVYNPKVCCVPDCNVAAAGMCASCTDRLVTRLKSNMPCSFDRLDEDVSGMAGLLPGPAVGNRAHAYTSFVIDIVHDVVRNSPVFHIDGDICLTAAWIAARLAARPHATIGYADMPALLACTHADVREFRLAIHSGLGGFIRIGPNAVRRVSRHNCFTPSLLLQTLAKAAFGGISCDELYAEDAHVPDFLRTATLAGKTVCVNRRAYIVHPAPDLRAQFETNPLV